MAHKSKQVAPRINHGKAVLPAPMINEMVALFNAGRWDQLEVKAQTMAMRHPTHQLGWSALGKAQLKLGKLSEAMNALSRLIKLIPGDADGHNDLGSVFQSMGRLSEAEASFRHALTIKPQFAEAHGNLGNVLLDLKRLDEALLHQRQAVELNPNGVASQNGLGNVLRDLGQLKDAEACYRRALEIMPNYFEGHLNLGITLSDLNQWDEAQLSYRRALALNPQSVVALHSLGNLLGRIGGQDEQARACFERAIALDGNSAEAYIGLGNHLLRMGLDAESQVMFRQAQQLRPLITWPAKKENPDFSVLLLDTPGAGCTPVDYLVGQAPYDRHFYCLMPDAPRDLDLLRSKGDVVINMIADADNGQAILPHALVLAEQLGRPIVNHPRIVMGTNRESVANRIAGIPLCRVPRTVRLSGATLLDATTNGCLAAFEMPVLVRLAGNHGGDDFEKKDGLQAVVEFAMRKPEANYYVTEYIDYRSADGFFRKYRVICLNGEVLPYHLAIHDDWMVHHFRTDMANQAWMRQEEEAFLRDQGGVFNEQQLATLKAIAAATGLDYCGIDCSVDREGRIVVFEANAAMLVHDEKTETFAYKNPYIAKIKDAFELMLNRLVQGQ